MTYPGIQIKDGDKVVETIQPEDLEEMLKGTAADDGIHYTAPDGKEYVIQVGPESEGTPLSNAEIVDRLKKDGNKNYELGADGEIYYTTPHKEKVKLDVTQNELLRRSLTYKVTLKTTEKGDPGTAGEQIATEKAKKDAIRSALTNAVDKLGIEDETTAAQLKAKISSLTFTPEQLDKGDTFTAEIGGKTYTLMDGSEAFLWTFQESYLGVGNAGAVHLWFFIEKFATSRRIYSSNIQTENGVVQALGHDFLFE